MFGQPGVYVSAATGVVFIPRHCLPDVQRRLLMMGRRLQDMSTGPTRRRRTPTPRVPKREGEPQ